MSFSHYQELFLASLARCNKTDDFLELFYDRFMASSQKISLKFQFADIDIPKTMLIQSLELSANVTTGAPQSLVDIRKLAFKHDRDHWDINPELYEHWLDSIVATASKCDEKWDDEIEEAWNRIMGHVIKFMASKY